jgi:hypothetical protein
MVFLGSDLTIILKYQDITFLVQPYLRVMRM